MVIFFSSSVHNSKCMSCHVVLDIFSFVFKHTNDLYWVIQFLSLVFPFLILCFPHDPFFCETLHWVFYLAHLQHHFRLGFLCHLSLSISIYTYIVPDFILFFYLCWFPLSLFMFSFIFWVVSVTYNCYYGISTLFRRQAVLVVSVSFVWLSHL